MQMKDQAEDQAHYKDTQYGPSNDMYISVKQQYI